MLLRNRLMVMLFAAMLSITAGTQAQAAKRLALLIGNSDYRHTGKLSNPANDVQLLAKRLEKLQFEVLLHKDLSSKDMKRAVRDFTGKLQDYGADTIGLVFYAGHGLQIDGLNYLVPVDANIERQSDVDIEAFDVRNMMSGMSRAGNNLNILVFDACRNNPYKSSFRSVSRGLAVMSPPQGSLIAFATAPNSVASDGEAGNSPFTAALADEILNPGLTIQSVFDRVRQRVHRSTGGKQWAWVQSSILGKFCPAGCQASNTPLPSPEAAVDNAASAGGEAFRAWQAVKDSKDRRLLQLFVKRYPESFYAEVAKVQISDLRAGLPTADKAPKTLVVAERKLLGPAERDVHGRYFVFLGAFKQQKRESEAAAEKRMRRVQRKLANRLDRGGFDMHIIDTNLYPNLTDGLWAVVQGPYTRDYAIFKLQQIKDVVPDAYVKAGR